MPDDSKTADISELERRVDDLKAALQRALKELRDAKVAASGVNVGDIVVYKGVEHRVCGVDASWKGKPWISGNPRRKDGSFGTAVRNLFSDWNPT